MSTKQLTEAIFEGGIRSVNFFNGRLLSAEDLSTQTAAHQQIDQRLGRAIGDGVAYGLEVSEPVGVSTATVPVITIQPGLALNREGRTLKLTTPVDLALNSLPANGTVPTITPFVTCKPPEAGVYVAGAGLYLLTIYPMSGREGRAPVSGLGNVAAACNTKYVVDGVQFRLIRLGSPTDLVYEDTLQNRMAYQCFGQNDLDYQSFYNNLFGPPLLNYGLLDTLRPNRLADCDVPLALLYLTADTGIKFIDIWAVRRRVTHPAVTTTWPLLTADRRLSEAEAMFSQFQDQVQQLRIKRTALESVVVTQYFRFLPPAGILPVTDGAASAGFTPATFFGNRAIADPKTTDANLIRSLLQEALYHEPIDLNSNDKIQLYVIYENLKAVENGQSNQLALIFASHTLLYRGVARFRYADWDFDRFASTVI